MKTKKVIYNVPNKEKSFDVLANFLLQSSRLLTCFPGWKLLFSLILFSLYSPTLPKLFLSWLLSLPLQNSCLSTPHLNNFDDNWISDLMKEKMGKISMSVYDGWQYLLCFLLPVNLLQNVTPLKVPSAWNLATWLVFACSQKVVPKLCRFGHCHSNRIPATPW